MIKGMQVFIILGLGMFGMQANAAPTWDINNNQVTYSVFQDNFELGDGITKSVNLSQLDLGEVARQEGVGAAGNYALTSVILSMNGTVYGSIYYKNNSALTVTPSFKVVGYSELSYGADVTPSESYSKTTAIGSIAPGGVYNETVNLLGSVSKKSVMIGDELSRFLGSGTIETIGTFPVDGYFTTGGTAFDSTVSLQGKADISVTYNYTYSSIPEPTSVALLSMGYMVLALRRGRVPKAA